VTQKQAESARLRADRRMLAEAEPQTCPSCGTIRRSAETLRVHRLIAHPQGGVTAGAAPISGT
jgi:hypothetical protein